ncbi:MAG: phosphoribosylanthranilate isomerase [Chitinispirillaceae bacterium]|nr:phosphoribosylanthranilate isomerase [Chitinispirillaceae bacterium]
MQPIRIKICGITREEDALTAAYLGVDALGFIFAPKSPRYIEPEIAAKIIAALPPFVSRVGVFVDADEETVVRTARIAGLDTLQLHGSETPEFCSRMPLPVVKALGLRPDFDYSLLEAYPVAGILLDSWDKGLQGGSGIAGDWNLARRITDRCRNVILAGGLGPSNVESAVEAVQPYGVDLNSGVEIMPGVKNPHKMRDAVRIIRHRRPLP